MNTKYKKYCYDFEVYSKINWFCVTFINYDDLTDEIVIVNDKDKLTEFWNNNKNNIFIGYNSRMYDTGIFKGILSGMKVGLVNDKLIKEGKKVFQVVKNAKKYQLYDYDAIIKDKSLKVCEAFMGNDIEETQVDFSIDRPLTDKEIKETLYYNKHDVLQLIEVLKYKWSDFQGQLDIIDLYDLNMSEISNTKVQLASKVLNVINQHTLDDEFEIRLPDTIDIPKKYQFVLDWYMNQKNWRYKEHLKSEDNQHPNQLLCNVASIPHVFGFGGCHGCNTESVVYEGIILDCDVASMYPNIDIFYKLLSRKFKNPEDFERMVNYRLELKAKKTLEM